MATQQRDLEQLIHAYSEHQQSVFELERSHAAAQERATALRKVADSHSRSPESNEIEVLEALVKETEGKVQGSEDQIRRAQTAHEADQSELALVQKLLAEAQRDPGKTVAAAATAAAASAAAAATTPAAPTQPSAPSTTVDTIAQAVPLTAGAGAGAGAGAEPAGEQPPPRVGKEHLQATIARMEGEMLEASDCMDYARALQLQRCIEQMQLSLQE